MTFEEIQQTFDRFAENHANAMIRMDRAEQDLLLQKENIQGLMRLAQTQLEISQKETSRREKLEKKVDGLEGKVDGIEEMTKILRQILEGRLRWPGDPDPEKN